MITAAELKQPAVFKLASITSMLERFGFYILTLMLVLFLKGEYYLTDVEAFSLFGIVTAFAFILPALGGFLADNVFGIKRCMVTGLLVEGIGLCLLAIPSFKLMPFALAIVVLGVGLYKTTPANLLGRAYKRGDPRIDGGFTMFYMISNIGSFGSSIIGGFLQKFFGWHIAFLAGGVGLFISMLLFFILKSSAADLDSAIGKVKLGAKKWGLLIIGIVISVFGCGFFISHAKFADAFFIVLSVAILGYYLYEIIRSPGEEKRKIIVCLILIIIGVVFFVLYMQAYTSIALFIERNTARTILGFTIPTEVFLGLNPFWVIILGPLLALTYKLIIEKFGEDIPITTKFGIGLLSVSLCFFILILSSFFANANAQVPALWLVFAFGIFTLGEMLIAALGAAMITHIIPQRMYGITMGTWFIGVALGAALAGLFAGLANIPKDVIDPHTVLHIYNSAFLKFGIAGLVVTVIVFIVGPYIKRIANFK